MPSQRFEAAAQQFADALGRGRGQGVPVRLAIENGSDTPTMNSVKRSWYLLLIKRFFQLRL